ncbi:MAG: hypothetical protein JWM19_7112 [Actinomycetia bacterium]|nr:hypothetical protein [Actinomycetes bacterium]
MTGPAALRHRWRQPGEGHDVSMAVGLVDVAALGRHQSGAVTSGETVSRVVETDELGGALRGEADLGRPATATATRR